MKYDLNNQEIKLLQAWNMKTLIDNYEGNVWSDQEKRMVNGHLANLKKLGVNVILSKGNKFILT